MKDGILVFTCILRKNVRSLFRFRNWFIYIKKLTLAILHFVYHAIAVNWTQAQTNLCLSIFIFYCKLLFVL